MTGRKTENFLASQVNETTLCMRMPDSSGEALPNPPLFCDKGRAVWHSRTGKGPRRGAATDA